MTVRTKKRLPWIIGGGVLVLGVLGVTLGPTLYRDLVVGPAANTPQQELELRQSDDDAPGGALGDALAAGEWSVSRDSFAGYRVEEVLNNTDVTVVGRTDQVSGTVTTTADTVESALIEVDVASIETDSGNRDDYFRTQTMDLANFPTATFSLDEPVQADPVPTVGDSLETEVAGTLSLNGVEQPVRVTVLVAATAAGVTVAGQIPISFADFGVTAPDLGFVRVEDSGQIEFSLVLQQP